MSYSLNEIKNGNSDYQIPTNFFVELIEQFESRLNQYKKRIAEIENLLDLTLEKESEMDLEAGNQESPVEELYQVLNFLYQNF